MTTVRRAVPADVPAVMALYPLLFAPPGSPPPQWDPADALPRLEAYFQHGAVFVADDGELVGFVTVTLDLRSVRFGQRAWVEDLAIDPARRSEGLGKRLLDAAKEWAREAGATHLELDSGDGRLDAHRFYDRELPSWTARSYGWILT